MIGYLTIGTNDLKKADEFYETLLTGMGATRAYGTDKLAAWRFTEGAMLTVTEPFDGETATAGNGTMVALAVETPEQVDALHARALELGGVNEGAPGPRGDSFYGGYFRDLDGNKLNFFCYR